jgi:predicted metal-dependent TIM-barrel fold hydrolase
MMNVRIFDPHVHMYSRTVDDYDKMSLCGVEMIVEPSFWLGSMRSSPHLFLTTFSISSSLSQSGHKSMESVIILALL